MKKVISLLIVLTIMLYIPLQALEYQNQSYNIKLDELNYVKKSVVLSNWSWTMLLGNMVSVPMIFFVSGIGGGILTMVTFAGWTLFQGFSAFALRDLVNASRESGSYIPDPDFATWAHILSASFGMGGITAGGLLFEDDTGAAVILTVLCCSVSWLCGIIGNFANYGYASVINNIPVASSLYKDYQYTHSDLSEPYKLPYGNNSSVYIPVLSISF